MRVAPLLALLLALPACADTRWRDTLARSEEEPAIAGRVFDERGDPQPGARVVATDGKGTRLAETWSEADGRFELRGSGLEAAVWIEAATANSGTRVTLSEGDDRSGVFLWVGAHRLLVRAACAREWVPSAELWSVVVQEGQSPIYTVPFVRWADTARNLVGITTLHDFDYRVVVRVPGLGVGVVGPGDVTELPAIATVQLRPGRTVKGRLVDQDGAPVEDAAITWGPNDSPALVLLSDREGGFVLEDMPPGYTTIHVVGPGCEPSDVSLVAGVTEREVTLHRWTFMERE